MENLIFLCSDLWHQFILGEVTEQKRQRFLHCFVNEIVAVLFQHARILMKINKDILARVLLFEIFRQTFALSMKVLWCSENLYLLKISQISEISVYNIVLQLENVSACCE